MIYIYTLAIAFICIIVIDRLEFDGVIANWIYRKTTGRESNDRRLPKPASCSLCSTFWLSLIMLIIMKQITLLNILYILTIAYFTPILNMVVTLAETIIGGTITKLIDFFQCSSRNNNIQD